MTSNLLTALGNWPWPLLATGSVILLLLVLFLSSFAAGALRLRWKLADMNRALAAREGWSAGDLRRVFLPHRGLGHLWQEFSETLHEQKVDSRGATVKTVWRSTVPAEMYFNAHNIVDAQLHTEFYKHFPGLFTGLGIIGTFAGLLQGLHAFKVTDDPSQVRQSLEFLLHGVSEAFMVSAVAISLAMVVTLLEKALLASLYRQTHRLAERLDSFFSSGANEEYLSRLVVSSEESATQSKHLKDALVGDLKGILHDLTDRQIQAADDATRMLGQQIRDGLHSSLQGPLNRLGGLVETASGDQPKAATQMLQDVMVSLSERLRDLFGGQIDGINALNQRTAQGMQDAVNALHQLVGNIESASRRSGDAMTDTMIRTVQEMDARQASINDQTRALVEQLRLQLAASQTQTQDKLREVVTDLGVQMQSMIGALQAQSRASFTEQEKREDILAHRTAGMVTSMGDTVSAVVGQLAESSVQMRQSVAILERMSSVSVERLNDSARTLERGATAFAAAGDRVSVVMERSAIVGSKMSELSGALTTSSGALQSMLGDYKASRDALAAIVGDLRAVVEAARREASMTEETLVRIQTAATALGGAQTKADAFLETVCNALEVAHEAFSRNVTATLDKANLEFEKKLGTAVMQLHVSVQHLEDTLSDFRVKA